MSTARETHRVDAGRLTDLDYARIDDAVGALIADKCHVVRETNHALYGEYNAARDVLSLTRLAHHSIGCRASDLRDVELDLIDQQVDALIWHYLNSVRAAGESRWMR